MGRKRRFTVVVLFTVSLGSAKGLGDSKGARAPAEQLFREGRALLDAERTSEACTKFAASHELEPALGTLLNLALCHELEGKTASAWRGFVKAVELAEQTGEQKRRAFAASKVKALEPGLSRLTIRAPSRDRELEVFLDDQPLPRAALGQPLPVDPGEHTLRAASPGAPEWIARVTVPAGASQSVIEIPAFEKLRASSAQPAVTVGPHPAAAAIPGEPAERHSSSSASSSSRTWALVAGGAGIAGLGVGAYFGLRALSAQRTVNAECEGRYCSDEGLKADRVVQDSVWPANIATGVGVVGLGLATYLWLSGGASSSSGKAFIVAPARGSLGVEATARF